MAFTMTRQIGTRLSEAWTRDGFPQWVRNNRGLAFEQYSLLVDALSQLHGARILHRNLTPGAITIRQNVDGRYAFALGRFEMSALLGNLVRTLYAPSRNHEYRTLMNALYLEPPAGIQRAHHLAYLAPETWPSLFDEAPEPRRDWSSTDVFGLGVFGWELFCGPLAETLTEPYAAVSTAGPGELLGTLETLHTKMRRHLQARSGRGIPGNWSGSCSECSTRSPARGAPRSRRPARWRRTGGRSATCGRRTTPSGSRTWSRSCRPSPSTPCTGSASGSPTAPRNPPAATSSGTSSHGSCGRPNWFGPRAVRRASSPGARNACSRPNGR
ncbi:hypothetical protein NQP46_30650 [Streptomyces albus]|nr:hypothetical protein NQP46_30650 [Streptomyces albus]